MAKANTTLDEELYNGLQTARKGKPRYFCLIVKGQEICKLIVQKKKITEGAANKAKTEAKGNLVIQGVVVGSGTDLAFEVLEAEPNIKTIKLKEFIGEQTDITCKPRWAVVSALQEVLEDEAPLGEAPQTVGGSTPPSDVDFAARARQSLVAREKTIKSGLEWAAKTKSPHEEAITKAHAAAREKLESAKTEEEFESAVQAHDDVIALIRKAIQEATPTKTPPPSEEVKEKDVTDELAQAIEGIKWLSKNQFANQAEVQRLAGLAKAVDSHVKANDKEQAALVLTELRTTFMRVRNEAKEAQQKQEQALEKFRNHPDAKYIAETIRAIWAWRGFDEEQKQAGKDAIAADNAISDPRKDLAKAQETRAKAKLACQAWDKEVSRVAALAEAFRKIYEPHREVIENAGKLFRRKGLPKPVTEALKELRGPYDSFTYNRTHDAYDGATKELDEVAKLAQKVVDAEKNLREAKERFDNADKAIRDQFAEANQFVQLLETQKLNVGSIKKLCDDLASARDPIDKKIQAFAYDDAIPLLTGLQSAITAVLNFKGEYESAKKSVDDRCKVILPDLTFARGMPDVNPTVVGDKKAMEDAANRLNEAYGKFDYIAAAAELDPLENVTQKLKLALEQLNREKAEFQAEWDKIGDDYKAVKNLGGRDKKVQTLVDALTNAYDELLVPFRAYDYVTAKAKVPAVKLAIDPLLTERPKQEAEWNKALKKVDSIKKKLVTLSSGLVSDALKQRFEDCNTVWKDAHKLADEGDFLGAKARLPDFVKAFDAIAKAVAAHDKVAAPKAKEARKQIETLDKKGELKKKTVAEKKALLDDLRGATEMSKDERKAQRLIYASLDLDDDFVEEDKKKRRIIAGKMTDTREKREELRDFRSNWQTKSLDQRLSIVRKALKAQCEALGFGDDPPEIVTFDDPGTKKLIENGFFSPDDGKIHLNTDSKASLNRDLESTLDLVFHENSHNYQYKLIARLDPSSPNPLDPTDPEYQQALLFQMNDGPHSYVKGEEDFTDYKKQPLEEHAHDNGPKTAKAVLDGLRTKKKTSTA